MTLKYLCLLHFDFDICEGKCKFCVSKFSVDIIIILESFSYTHVCGNGKIRLYTAKANNSNLLIYKSAIIAVWLKIVLHRPVMWHMCYTVHSYGMYIINKVNLYARAYTTKCDVHYILNVKSDTALEILGCNIFKFLKLLTLQIGFNFNSIFTCLNELF